MVDFNELLIVIIGAQDNLTKIMDVIHPNAIQVLNAIGDNSSEAAALAFTHHDVDAAIANLYNAFTAYKRTAESLWFGTVRFVPFGYEIRKRHACKLLTVCVLMATCKKASGKTSELPFWKREALYAFDIYETSMSLCPTVIALEARSITQGEEYDRQTLPARLIKKTKPRKNLLAVVAEVMIDLSAGE